VNFVQTLVEGLDQILQLFILVAIDRGRTWARHEDHSKRLERYLPLLFGDGKNKEHTEELLIFQLFSRKERMKMALDKRVPGYVSENRGKVAGLCNSVGMLRDIVSGTIVRSAEIANRLRPDESKDRIASLKRESKDPMVSGSIPHCELCDLPACVGAEKLKKCGRCKIAWYCSVADQREDWSTHRALCFVAKDSGGGLEKQMDQ
jgi:hypothetical protein